MLSTARNRAGFSAARTVFLKSASSTQQTMMMAAVVPLGLWFFTGRGLVIRVRFIAFPARSLAVDIWVISSRVSLGRMITAILILT